MSETNLVRACLRELRSRGCFVWRQNSGANVIPASAGQPRRFVRFNDAPGCSDIIGVTPWGRFLAIECKVGRNKPTDKQRAFLDAVTAAGGIALVVTDDTAGMWDAIEQAKGTP